MRDPRCVGHVTAPRDTLDWVDPAPDYPRTVDPIPKPTQLIATFIPQQGACFRMVCAGSAGRTDTGPSGQTPGGPNLGKPERVDVVIR
jgi:hypothetical protein